MNHITKLAIFLISTMSFSINAGATWHTSQVNTIYPLSNGTIVLTFKTHNTQCTNSSKYHYITVGKNGVKAEAMPNILSVALTAATLGKPLTINFESSGPECYINRVFLKF
jgi:hypothetical protein